MNHGLRLWWFWALAFFGAGQSSGAETVFEFDFSEGYAEPWSVAAQSSGVVAGAVVNTAGELDAELAPDGSNPSWLAGVRAYYLTPANGEADRARLRFSFRARAEFGGPGGTEASVRVRIFGFGTSESDAAVTRDFTVTETMQTFVTMLDEWTGENFDPLREANAVYFDVGGAIGERPWPRGPVAGGMRLVLDDIRYEALPSETPADPVEYFVAPGGNDQANGRSEATAFASIQRAANVTRPGDVVTVLDGDYVESVAITRSGAAGAPITFRARNRHGARVRNSWGNVFHIGADSARVGHIVIDGFDVSTGAVYGSGIKSDRGAHHLYVKNNYAHDCGESGIQLNDGDYRFIEGNITARNGWLMPDAGSGISLWGFQPFDDAPGWRTIVRNNISYANDNGPATARTDGNGIIIDDFRNTQGGHTGAPVFQPGYEGFPTLVEGNLVFGNGGKGIQVFVSNQVRVVHNTAFLNNRRADIETWRGEINVSCSANVTVANNLAVTDSSPRHPNARFNTAYLAATPQGSTPASGALYAANVVFRNNVALDLNRPGQSSIYVENVATAFLAADGNRLALDHGMIAPTLDPGLVDAARAAAFFGLLPDAVARDAGDDTLAASLLDLGAWPRRYGAAVDAGAYEFAPRSHWWAMRLGTVAPVGDAAPDADIDGDGRPNLLEYAFDTDPLRADVSTAGGEPRLATAGRFTFARLRDDLEYVVERSYDLSEWQTWLTNPGAVGELVDIAYADDSPRIFLRLRIRPSEE